MMIGNCTSPDPVWRGSRELPFKPRLPSPTMMKKSDLNGNEHQIKAWSDN